MTRKRERRDELAMPKSPMPIPEPIRLFHITAIANLPAICSTGSLLAKARSSARGIAYQSIAHRGAQGARAVKSVPDPPGGIIHDYVPFYFAPRSPMLFAINGGRVEGCPWRQADIVHLETTVTRVVSGGKPFVFYDRNATLEFSTPYTDLAHLGEAIAWDLLTEAPQLDGFCKYWQSRAEARYSDRMERRQAEFLVKGKVSLSRFTRFGVIDSTRAAEVTSILTSAGVRIPVVAMPDWYF